MTELKSSNLSVNEKLSRNLPNQVQQLDLKLFDIWNSGRKAKKRVKMTEPKSSNFKSSVLKNCQRIYQTVQQLDLKLLWYMEFRWKSRKQSWCDGNQVQQLECEWEIVKKFTKLNSSNLIWNCFDKWNSGRKAKIRVEMTEIKSSNLSVNEKLSRNLPNQVQQLDLKLLWYMEFRSKSLKRVWRNPSPATWVCMRNCQEIYQTNSSNLIWNCFDKWNSGRKAKNRVEMTELKSSNLSVNEKLSRNLPNQVQQLDLKLFDKWNSGRKAKKRVKMTELKSSNLRVEKLSKNLPNQFQQLDFLFWYMEFRWKSQSRVDVTELKSSNLSVEKFEIYQTNCNLIWNCFDKWNSGRKAKNRVEMTELKSSNLSDIWEIVKKFTKPSPATWFEIAFDIWNSGRKAKNRVEMTEPKSSNLSVHEKLSRIYQTKSSNLIWNCFDKWNSGWKFQSWCDGTQVQQLECEWEIVKKFTKPIPATWFEIALINGIPSKSQKKSQNDGNQVQQFECECLVNCQDIYQTNSSNLIWNCFDKWNSGRKAKNRVEMTELKSSNLSVYEKLSRNLPNQVQQLDLKLFRYMEFRSKSQKKVKMTEPKSSNFHEKLSRNLPNQVQQLDLKLFW